MTIPMWQKLPFRRIASFAFVALFVFGGFGIGIQEANAADLTITQCQAKAINADCYFLTEIDPSKYDDLGACVGGRRCMKPKLVGANCAAPNKCETTCGGTEYYGNDATQGTCTGALCCKPKDACVAPTGGCTSNYVGNAAYDQHGYILDGYCDGSGPQKCYKLAVASKPACTALTPTAGVCKAACASTEGLGNGTCPTGGNKCCVPNGSTTGGGGSTTTSFTNPLQYNTVQDVLGSLLTTLQGIIVILSIVFIIIGALLYITSGGSESQIKTAKSAIFAAMIGLAIGIAAPSFLKEISNILGWGKDKLPDNVSGAVSLTTILTNVLNFLLGITGILALIMLIVGALMFLSSAGDENKLDAGKKIVKASIIGVIVTFAALLIVKQIAALFVV